MIRQSKNSLHHPAILLSGILLDELSVDEYPQNALKASVQIILWMLFFLCVGVNAQPIQTQPDFIVPNLNDSGMGSLREALISANSLTTTQTIRFSVSGVLSLSSALPPVTGRMRIYGGPAEGTTIRAPNQTNIFVIEVGGFLGLENLTLTGGFAAEGGAIKNYGTVETVSCRFSGNRAEGSEGSPDWWYSRRRGGGAIWNSGVLRSVTTLFEGNIASKKVTCAGAIFSTNGMVYLDGCTFSRNSVKDTSIPFSGADPADANGGAIYLVQGGATIDGCIFVSNAVTGGPGRDGGVSAGVQYIAGRGGNGLGGAIWVGETTNFFVTNCTFSANQAIAAEGGRQWDRSRTSYRPLQGGNGSGGAVFCESGTQTFVNCTFAFSTVFSPTGETGGSASGNAIGGGSSDLVLKNNLFAGNSGSPEEFPGLAIQTANLLASQEDIFPLADNGGPTLSHAVAWNSRAINGGNLLSAPLVDQRGAPRPAGAAVDIGAVEMEFIKPVFVSVSGDQRVFLGTNLVLFAYFSGPQPITVTWYKDGATVSTGTSQTLSLMNIQRDGAGTYWASASNEIGETTSPEIKIEVEPGPTVVVDTPGRFAAEGEIINLTASVFADIPYTLQWFHNEGAIPNATNRTLSISGLTSNSTGEYRIRVQNALGEFTSPAVTMQLWPELLVETLMDDGPKSLRVALAAASTTPEALFRTIRIVTNGIIRLSSPLPPITNSIKLSGSSAQSCDKRLFPDHRPTLGT